MENIQSIVGGIITELPKNASRSALLTAAYAKVKETGLFITDAEVVDEFKAQLGEKAWSKRNPKGGLNSILSTDLVVRMEKPITTAPKAKATTKPAAPAVEPTTTTVVSAEPSGDAANVEDKGSEAETTAQEPAIPAAPKPRAPKKGTAGKGAAAKTKKTNQNK